jgi:hypothetical protein
MELRYSTGALYWERGPGVGFTRAFNEFITHIGAVGPTITAVPTAFGTLVSELMVNHDFDFICIGLTNLGRYVDWAYDLLNSANDVPWGWNFAGIHDSQFDEWTEIILTSLNVSEVVEAASKVQYRFIYELMPWFPVSAGMEFSTAAKDTRGELMNIIPMPNFGSQNDWSFMAVHWKGEPGVAWPGGTYKYALGAEWHTLNPWTEDTLYGWNLLDRTIVGLTGVEPYTLTDIPFVATQFELKHWVSIPELGITDGSMITFYLRQDVKWQDGMPVTAYDCVNNMRLMRKYKPGRYSTTWSQLVYEEADGPYKFTTYHATTSLYWAPAVAGTALMTPKHVMDKVEALYGDIVPWTPNNPYKDLMGVDPPAKYSFMKQIVGCGPYVFDSADLSTMTAHVVKYDEFFVNAPVIGGVVGEWRIDPGETYTYKVLAENIAAKEDSENGELVSVTVDVKVYEDDTLKNTITDVTLDPFEYVYLGPYTTGALAGGNHTIKVEIYEGGSLIHTYVHKFVATLRVDITSYSGDAIDLKVDIKDVARAARAFGSSPVHLRWDPPCDVNDDFKVDIRDIAAIARRFGWKV